MDVNAIYEQYLAY